MRLVGSVVLMFSDPFRTPEKSNKLSNKHKKLSSKKLVYNDTNKKLSSTKKKEQQLDPSIYILDIRLAGSVVCVRVLWAIGCQIVKY